jgi:hypothetical protein
MYAFLALKTADVKSAPDGSIVVACVIVSPRDDHVLNVLAYAVIRDVVMDRVAAFMRLVIL